MCFNSREKKRDKTINETKMRKKKIIQKIGFVFVAIGAATSIYNFAVENPSSYIASAGYFLLAIGMVFIAINGIPKKHELGKD